MAASGDSALLLRCLILGADWEPILPGEGQGGAAPRRRDRRTYAGHAALEGRSRRGTPGEPESARHCLQMGTWPAVQSST
jgi:hypothetical protein